MKSPKTRSAWAMLVCKALFVTICLWVTFSGHHPPLIAQNSAADYGNAVNNAVNNAVQTKRVDDVVERLDKSDVRMDKMWSLQTANANAISGMQGEERGLFALLALLQVLGMVFMFRKSGKGSGD